MGYTYTTLSAALNTWSTRPYAQPQIDEFIMLAEAAFARNLRGYQREVTGTVALTDGVGALPDAFIRFVSVSYSTFGTLRQVSPDSLVVLNPAGRADIPLEYAITAGSIKTAFIVTADLAATWLAGLAPLSGSNATNWLLDLAPDAYLFMIKAQARAFEEEWQTAAGLEAKALSIVGDLNLMSDVAQYGRASLVINGPTP